ncbi:hypothetical protein L2E82_45016 [Cichorium intybus]|uniref:Uncharacterized protein n=1 Tax=Cichorium intybus TaxID=13427 RepID=A0ACB8ZW81_CICIN|nr:hypothetical protein L2E82_45016 [Cichorium intybus]
MKNIVKSRKEDANASSSFTRLPDEIILQVLNKLIDSKTLICCYLVSKRFSSIVVQVDAISFTAPFLHRRIPDENTVSNYTPSRHLPPELSSFHREFFGSANMFLSKFKGVRSLCVTLPSSSEIGIDNRCLFKWRVKFGNRIESFIFLSPKSVRDEDGFYLNQIGDEEENIELINDLFNQKIDISFQCLYDAMASHKILLYLLKDLPMLEEVSITGSGRRGKLFLSGEKLREVKEWVHSSSETMMDHVEIIDIVRNCYIPVLKLPVSGYVMKGIDVIVIKMKGFQGGNDGLMNSNDGFEDKEEAAYTEAVMEILNKHKGMMHTIWPRP